MVLAALAVMAVQTMAAIPAVTLLPVGPLAVLQWHVLSLPLSSITAKLLAVAVAAAAAAVALPEVRVPVEVVVVDAGTTEVLLEVPEVGLLQAVLVQQEQNLPSERVVRQGQGGLEPAGTVVL